MSSNLEARVAKIEGILEQMDKRLTRVENEITHLREEIRRVESRLWWIVGILITMWISIITTILLKP
ncbi:MAG: hypothetical protein DRJ40_05560 [Thermoprotei archaeon]|nr:MAG: hypothetical protein DRJ40_03965 [Thermoprotei archaeon]RLE56858.1 MAG: hypothetical protein DRJ40_05560 [Thermoprotei archaeon]